MEGKNSEDLAQEQNGVHREPHPYVVPDVFKDFSQRTVCFVGKVKEIKEVKDTKRLVITRSDNKTEVQVNNYKGDPGITGKIIEIRGIVNKDNKTLSYGQHTVFNDQFDQVGFDKMLDYYHGLCRHLILGK
ncbi:unnamed protein product [Moneuplotes crassus]|uniref:Replication factor A protein 3 n=1 Tax=Euplotes crassus TaxID=5936 RepID=A0AAD2D0I9_EUPCR|nr:unnamed protein product [Moneuplotes crassus]